MRNDTPLGEFKIMEASNGATFSVHVQPRASRNEICGLHGEAIKIRLTSPPVEGEANRLCIEYLAKLFGVPKSSVAIIAGERSRQKTIRVSGIDPESIRKILAGVIPRQ